MSGDSVNLKMACRLLAAVLCLATALPAGAGLAIRVERLSDTDALLSVSGALDGALPGGNAHSLALLDPFSTRPPDNDASWVLEDSDLRAGDFLFNFANQAGRCAGGCPGSSAGFDNSGRANTIYFGNNELVFPLPFPFRPIPSSVALTGSMSLQLQNGATFAPVGTVGDVYWGTTAIGLGKGVLVGSWEVVAVPEPAAYAMMLAGLGLVGFIARRRGFGSSRATLPE